MYLDFNFARLTELYGYLEDGDYSYGELQEIRDKLEDLRRLVEEAMDSFDEVSF